MTVVNYSVQESFGGNVFFFEGTRGSRDVLASDRFHSRWAGSSSSPSPSC
jgi:glycerol transport system permease protein